MLYWNCDFKLGGNLIKVTEVSFIRLLIIKKNYNYKKTNFIKMSCNFFILYLVYINMTGKLSFLKNSNLVGNENEQAERTSMGIS